MGQIRSKSEAWLKYFLNVYIKMERPKLLLTQSHDYFFITTRGEPFSVNSIHKYLGDLFERHLNARIGTTAFRHAIVTHFLSLKDSEDLQLSESLARAMKHSRKMQQTYDTADFQSKSKRGRSFTNTSFTSVVLDDLELSSEDSSSKYLEPSESEIKPHVNDVVALVSAESTPSKVIIYLGKLIRFSEDCSEAMLLEFKEISPNLFKPEAGSV